MPLADAARPDRLPDIRISAAAPPGYIGFCIRFSDQCAASRSEGASVSLNSQVWKLLATTNEVVNAAIWPEDDQKHYGHGEYWTIPTDGYGDCEDVALAKRKALLAAGLQSDVLRLAVVQTRRRETLAVLTVVTDKGDFVLDNLRPDVVSWSKAGYDLIGRQDPELPSGWASLTPANQMLANNVTTATGPQTPH
jgi:predicted transglutaminase-like cysteine proteinase